ncbi:MAG: DUF4340 domain-containing protein [Proteobacteria bacterium]|nr:DUF4340 domain-containing protein [Pseudomonadota bacterium]
MNKQFLVILGVLVVVLGGGALLVFEKAETAKPAVVAQLGQPLLKGLKASEVASISIREPKESLTLAKKDGRWTIAEKNGFAADLDRVTDLVVKAIELKAGQVEPIGEKDRPRLMLADKGEGAATAVTFKAADGKILAELLVGKKYFKKEPEGDASKTPGDGRFVMLPSDPKQVYTVSDPLRQATAATGQWISKEGLAIEKVKTLEVKPAEGNDGYRIERVTDGIDWKLDRAAAGQKLDVSRANAASYSLNKLEIEDLAAADADTGLDKPTVVTATTFDGLTYTLRIGKTDKDRTFVKAEVEGTPKREPGAAPKDEKPEAKEKREKAFADEVKALEERVAREKSLKDFVLVVSAKKLSDTLKKRADLLEQKKPEGKK